MDRRHKCPGCEATFSRKSGRDRHFERQHGGAEKAFDCVICGQVFNSVILLHKHILRHEPESEYTLVENLFDGALTQYRKNYLPPTPDLALTFGSDVDNLTQIIAVEAAVKKYAKCSVRLTAEFIQVHNDEIVNSITIHFRCHSFTITPYQDHSTLVMTAMQYFRENIDSFVKNGSGYVLQGIYRTEIDFARCAPLSGSCGILSISSCKDLERLPQSALNMDKKCFFYSVARHFVKKDDYDDLVRFIDFHMVTETIAVPVKISSVKRFEELNKHLNIRINILYEEEGAIYPIFTSERAVDQDVVNILLYKVLINGQCVNHYAYIGDLNKCLRKVYRGAGGITYEKAFVCPNCLCKFSSPGVMNEHLELCRKNKPQKIVLPVPGDKIVFKNHIKKFKAPITGFYDFESAMSVPDSPCMSCTNISTCHHSTTVEAVQTAVTYSLILVNQDNRIIHSNTYSGNDCAEKFVSHLLDLEPTLQTMLSDVQPMNLTVEEERAFRKATVCHICEKEFILQPVEGKLPDIKVRDHCHLNSSFQGAAHQSCNLLRQVCKKVSLFCHNFTGKISYFH